MDLILGFAFVLILSLLFAGVIILLGRSVAPKARTTGAAVESYACGEPAFEGGKIQFNLPLFNYALYFLFFESLGFILFLSWQSPGLVVITYLLVTLVAAMYVSLTPKEIGQEAV
ncbi:MAG: NADH-quinone oxidoreductase subunit A [Candidatus Thorarchaeota archaeon]|nr:NADH-quinone oxidoreductase subunit A [Candidatus Thorarchaeota archaeon]